MSHFTRAHLAAMSFHQACRILLIPISQSYPPIEYVAFRSCSSRSHVLPSSISRLANPILTAMSHFTRAYLAAMSFHQVCRILLKSISQSWPHIKHVAFHLCSSHIHAHRSNMSHFAHAHLVVLPTHRACRISLVLISRSCPLI